MDAIDFDAIATLDLDPVERWNVFNRLQELAIPCQCACGQPLRVDVETPTAAIQVWSVTQQLTVPREITLDRLERCWRKAAWK
jgi:hypothetical protein